MRNALCAVEIRNRQDFEINSYIETPKNSIDADAQM